jgi:hypothetical protein
LFEVIVQIIELKRRSEPDGTKWKVSDEHIGTSVGAFESTPSVFRRGVVAVRRIFF